MNRNGEPSRTPRQVCDEVFLLMDRYLDEKIEEATDTNVRRLLEDIKRKLGDVCDEVAEGE